MRTAVDTSILVDVLSADSTHGKHSRSLLRSAYSKGAILVCSLVWAETRARFADEQSFLKAMQQLGASCSPLSEAVCNLAGQRWRDVGPYEAERMPIEVVVGAHAVLDADALLTRAGRVYRAYFADLKLVE